MMRLGSTLALAVAISASCSKSRSDTAKEPIKSAGSDESPGSAAVSPADILDEDGRPPAAKLCRSFDRVAVARAMGWTAFESAGTFGRPSFWSCMYMAVNHPEGAGFGVTFSTDKFMDVHLDAPYVKRPPIAGHDAVVAKHADGKFVSIQVHARGITIETNVNDAGLPDEAEKRLANATIVLIDSLTLDPASMLER
jgi:hypothetical protein